jgi:8-oxo-dGTP pyrophosphatase MutT (NUDIX family)
MTWKPDVTVAAVVERDGHFLFVEERAGGRVVLNQPAGHLENGETFFAAVARETLEETGWTFVPEAIVYRQQSSTWDGIVDFNDVATVKRHLAYFDEVWAGSLIQPELRAMAVDF